LGSVIEINDTLKISRERGFPDLNLGDHVKDPVSSNRFLGQEFSFYNPDERLYNRPPTRVVLVQEIEGKWLFWGHAMVVEQTIRDGKTSGKYVIKKLYDPMYQRLCTMNEAPQGKSYFSE
jgi:hypothetical protein